MKAFSGFSTNADAYLAGAEAAKQVSAAGLKVAFVYASCDYDLKKVIKGVSEKLKCPIIGNTSFTGVIMQGGYVGGDKPFVGIMALAGKDIDVGVAIAKRSAYKSAREAGIAVAKKALLNKTAPNQVYMVASPTEEEQFLKGISEVIGRVPTFGGSCADNEIAGKWSLYTDKGITSEGVAVAFIYSKAEFKNEFTGAYNETKDMGIITEIKGRRTLVSIDGVPAVKKYAKWRGMKEAKLAGGALLSETILSPLGIKDRLGDLVAIRHPMFANDDLSMNIGADLAVGTAVVRMECTQDELIKSVKKTLQDLKKKVSGDIVCYHLVHCGGRRAGIGDRIKEVYKAIKAVVGTTPFIMEFTFGEYGYVDDGNNTTGGLMLSFSAYAN